jgi:hypothetical protein
MIIMLTANSWIFYLAQWVILLILSISWRYFRDLFLRVAAPQIGIAMLLVSVFWAMGEKETAWMLWTAFPVYQVPLLFCGVAYREVAALGASCIAAGVPLHRAGSVLCSGIVLLPFLMGDSRIS